MRDRQSVPGRLCTRHNQTCSCGLGPEAAQALTLLAVCCWAVLLVCAGISGASYYEGSFSNIARSAAGDYVAVSSRGNFFMTWTPGQVGHVGWVGGGRLLHSGWQWGTAGVTLGRSQLRSEVPLQHD
jgi:hypothetical protein